MAGLLGGLVVLELLSVLSHWNDNVALIILVLNHLVASRLLLAFSMWQDYVAEILMVDPRVLFLYDRVLVPIIVFLFGG